MNIYKPDKEKENLGQQSPTRGLPDHTKVNTGTAATTSPVFPPLTHQRLENCAFSAWYSTFRTNTIKSRIIPLSEDFVSYLNADGVCIPGQSHVSLALSDSESEDEDDQSNVMDRLKTLQEETIRQAQEQDSDSSDDEDQTNVDDQKEPYFPALEREIAQAIEDLGGEVFPKLNWSSPRDASWIATTNTLKCHNIADIFLLLKSSDFVAHDLIHAYEDCSDEASGQKGAGVRQRPEIVELVLRKWFDLAPSMEFRCFVRDNQLVGISQRDMTYYEFLKNIQDELEQKIVDFYDNKIRNKFPDPDYTFDVYITRTRERIYLIDFNPFAQKTDSLLFEWEELLLAQERMPLRLLSSEAAGQHMRQPFAFNRYPVDVTELSNGQTVADFAEAFYKKVQAAAK
ncbi:hypothetical protein BGZ65_005147 [Modicella reniformis]|uniref:Cell division cycle protein 123 n=1 Tax=Modicella reniformis TaxID=1440133 RepID=A0A9P6M8P2_9FUNG|nr:hypothetical protein BGZ65_005147 [Modicella reniformis]